MSRQNSQIRLSDHFTYGRLFRYTLPSVVMLIFTSVYGVVDGFFVSNFAGKVPFTAVNFIMPFLMILGCVGFMFGTGGSALIAMTMGRKDEKRALQQFSMLVYASIVIGFLLSALGQLLLPSVGRLLGGSGQMLTYAIQYGRICLIALPAYILQYEFQCLFSTAEKPRLGLFVTVAAGCTNIVLDALFVAGFHWGLAGAAAATSLSQTVGGVVPVIYFARKNSSRLKLVKARFNGRDFARICSNGVSELMSDVAMSLVSMLYNAQLLKYVGQDGVAAYGVLMYLNMIFLAIFIGYSVGVSPVVSYHYGAGTEGELTSLLRKSLRIIAVTAVLMFAASEKLAGPLSKMFVGYDPGLFDLTRRAFFFYSFTFLFAGFSIYGSSFFTALNNGLISALISFLRVLAFQVSMVLVLPLFLGVDGIWISIPVAELLSMAVTFLFLARKRQKYGYQL